MATNENRTALVTGASRGIGASIAERLAADGFNVIVNYAGSEAAAHQNAYCSGKVGIGPISERVKYGH